MTTTTKAKLGVECLLAALLFLCLGANAGQMPCSTIVRYPANCPVTVDMKYMRLDAGSYSQCFDRVNYSLARGIRNIVLRPPAPITIPPPPDPALVNAVIRHVDSILTRTVALRNDLDQRLTQVVRPLLLAQYPFLTVGYTHGRVTGPISVSFLGQPSGGTLRFRVAFGLDIAAKIRVRRINGLLLRGRATLRRDNVVFSANYDVNSGRVTGLALMGGPLRIRVQGKIAIIPFRFSLDFTPFAQSFLDAKSFTIFGLDTDVPAGKFVHNGTDYGLVIKRQLRDFVESVDVTITQGGKNLGNAYLNISVGSSQLTAGRIVTVARAGPRREALPFCAPSE